MPNWKATPSLKPSGNGSYVLVSISTARCKVFLEVSLDRSDEFNVVMQRHHGDGKMIRMHSALILRRDPKAMSPIKTKLVPSRQGIGFLSPADRTRARVVQHQL